jgi:hypothetical protein
MHPTEQTPPAVAPPEALAPRSAAPAPPARRRRRRWPIVVGALLALLALPVSYYFYNAWASERDLQAAMAAIERQDPRWRFDDILADQAPIPDDQNPALRMLEVDKLQRAVSAGGFFLGADKYYRLFDDLPSPNKLNAPQEGVLREALEKYADAVKLARTLKDFPGTGRFPIKHGPDWINTNLDPLQRARNVMSMLQYDAMLRAHDGDAAGAMESCQALLCASRSLGEEPFLIAALIRYAGEQISVATLERVLAQTEPGEDRLRAMQELLEKEIAAPILVTAIRGERGGMDKLVEDLQKGKVKVSALTGSGGNNSWETFLLDLFPAFVASGRGEQLALMTRAVEASKLPAEQQGKAFDDIEQETRATRTIVVRLLMPACSKVAMAHRRTRATLNCALVGVAVERYRLKNRQWPESLDAAIQQGFLKAVPTDPFDGQPLRYKRLADGVVIYSVGYDGVDNGGVISNGNPYAAGTDLGFRLWDPDARQQPPLPPPLDDDGGPP